MNVFGLVQLSQATQQFNTYSYSFGIETLARRHQLSTADQLLALLTGLLHAALGPADGVASGISFRAARTGNFAEVPDVCRAMSSDRLPVNMRLASMAMGNRLWEVSRQWDWAGPVHEQLDPVARDLDMHHAVAFGALVSETTSQQVRAIAAYLFNMASSIVAAAVRLVPLEESVGNHVLATMQPTIAQLAGQFADKHPGDIIALGAAGTPADDAFEDLFHQ